MGRGVVGSPSKSPAKGGEICNRRGGLLYADRKTCRHSAAGDTFLFLRVRQELVSGMAGARLSEFLAMHVG